MRHAFRLILAALVLAGCAHQQPPVTERIAVTGGELEVNSIGRGEPLLLINGSLLPDSFAGLTREPSLTRYRLITFHRRRTGSIQDQANDALTLLDRLGIQRAHVAGHSYGGDIALQLAADHPDRVASLILLEPALFAPTPATQSLMADVQAAAELHAKGNDREAVTRFLSSVAGNEQSAIVDRAVTEAPSFFDVELPALQSWKFTIDNAKSIHIPTLLIAGSETREPFKETVNALRRALPDAEEKRIAGATHLLEVTHPMQVAEVMAGFLARHGIR
jgi:3-oxoadipate enol-lactonase